MRTQSAATFGDRRRALVLSRAFVTGDRETLDAIVQELNDSTSTGGRTNGLIAGLLEIVSTLVTPDEATLSQWSEAIAVVALREADELADGESS